MLDGYIFPTERLSNELHEIDDNTIDKLFAQNEQVSKEWNKMRTI